MNAPSQPIVYVIAGPNGSGKTTFARKFLPDFVQCRQFLNADLIAAGLAPFAPESQALVASGLVLEQARKFVHNRQSFSLETTLAGRSYSKIIPQWQAAGFQVVLFFLWLPTADLAVERVAGRVKQGGHSIPEPDIRRRYQRGLKNLFNLYLPIVDFAYVYNGAILPPVAVWNREGKVETVLDTELWLTIQSSAKES